MSDFSSSKLFEDRMDRSIIDRSDDLPARIYILCMSVFITGGLVVSALVASYTYNMKPTWLWFVGYLVIAIPGVMISVKSDNWLISLFGYAMVVVPSGAILGPYVHLFTYASVEKIALVTIVVSAAIGVAGALYPKSVEHWGGFLFVALVILVIGNFSQLLFPAFGMQPIVLAFWDWVGVVLFSGFIFYDMNRAMRMAYTLDNAVDNAVALYLDIFNLFIRLLELFGNKSSD